MRSVMQDLRFAARSFARSPRFAVPAILALALGIGATSATFSVVRGVILRPLPYSNPERIVVVWESNARRNRNVIADANFVEWRERHRSFTHLAMAGPTRLSVMLGGQAEEIVGKVASADLFPVLGVQPALGRPYGPSEDEEGRDGVIIVSDEFWRTRLGARPDVIGTTITTSGRSRTLIGVMPAGFTLLGERTDFLVPYGWTTEGLRAARGRGYSFGIARLRDGVSFEQASLDMKGIGAQLAEEAPQRNTGWSITLVPVHEQMVDQIRPALQVLAGAALFVLLVSCVNVANLLLARSTSRVREMGVRTVLGAGRGRLIRQLLVESLSLAAIGGIAGLALAFLFHRGLLALVADELPIPRLNEVSLDLTVVMLTMGLSLVTGLVFGLVPAIVSARSLNDSFREGGRHGGGPRARRVLGTLVAAEVALSLVLLTGAGLLVRSFVRLSNIRPGFRAEGLLTMRVQLPVSRYDTSESRSGFATNALARIGELPGVRSAAGVTFLPLAGPGIGTSFWRTDQPTPGPGQAPSADVTPITPGYFRTMGIPHVMGRDFTTFDRGDSPPVAIVNETMVRLHLTDGTPIGKRVHVNAGFIERLDYEIVGVVGDVKLAALDRDIRPTVYLPHTQLAIPLMTLVVRTEANPLALAPSVGAVVHTLDRELPLADVRTMQEVVDATLARPRTVTVLLVAFAVMALLLAAVGVYGVMAYSVAQRTQEIGVRMALGATPRSVFDLVLAQALRLVGIGVITGLVLAAALTRLLAVLLYEIEPLDAATFIVTTVVLTAVAMVACYVPARRGTRIAPVQALRAD
jgi:putative ABC transport system permease protein